jgi:hypothetical protein
MIIVGTSQTTFLEAAVLLIKFGTTRISMIYMVCDWQSIYSTCKKQKIDPWSRKKPRRNPAETPFSSIRVGSLAATVLFVFLCCFYLAGRPVQESRLGPSDPPKFWVDQPQPQSSGIAEGRGSAKCHRLKAMAGKCRRSSPVAVAVFQRETKTRNETNWWSCTNSQSDDFAGPVSGSIRLNYQGKLTELVD